MLGSVTLPVSSALYWPGQPRPPAQMHALTDAGGYPAGEVSLQCLLVAAPAPGTPLQLLVGTWNVGNEAPSADLSAWLRNEGEAAELVAVGSQECSYPARGGYRDCDADWQAAVGAALGPSYELLRADGMGQMKLLLFARFDALPGVSGHEATSEATGIAHLGVNKGGVVGAVTLWDTSLAFVSAHLAAHQNKVKRRNEDFAEIVSNCVLGQRGMEITNQYHHLVFMGDLNYRLDLTPLFGAEAASAKSPPKELFDTITASVAAGNLSALLACDQLNQARAAGEAFAYFQEGAITHAPTFKVRREPGLVYNEQRSPAFCDRILWRSLPGMVATQQALWAAAEVASSDHKPVGAAFALSRCPPRTAFPAVKGATPSAARTGVVRASARQESKAALRGAMLQTWKLQVTRLFGHGLMAADFNGKSDPYVAFMGPAVTHMRVTDVVFGTLDPAWPSAHLPTIVIAATDAAVAASEYVFMDIMDYDASSQDDPIGGGALRVGALLESAAANGGEASFDVEVTQGGLPQGRLSGKVTVSQGPPMSALEFQKVKTKDRKRWVAPAKSNPITHAFLLNMGLIKDGAPPTAEEHAALQRESVESAAASQRKKAASPASTPRVSQPDEEDDD